MLLSHTPPMSLHFNLRRFTGRRVPERSEIHELSLDSDIIGPLVKQVQRKKHQEAASRPTVLAFSG